MKKSAAYWAGYNSVLVKVAGLPGGGTLADWENLMSGTPENIKNPWQEYQKSAPMFGGADSAELEAEWVRNQALGEMYRDYTLAKRRRMSRDPRVQAILRQTPSE